MKYEQIKVTCKTKLLEQVCAVMSMVDNGLMIEDYSDIDENLKTVYGELIDESILNADKSIASVSIFIPEERDADSVKQFLNERFATLSLDVIVTTADVEDEDWATSWKKYYKPSRIGEKIVIVPLWEKYTPEKDDVVITLDPGMAFGTGSHETTRLVISLIEKYINKGDKTLDIGTGSGILAITASKLGAEFVDAFDIDPVAVRVARENCEINKTDNITCNVSDLLSAVDKNKKYNFISANIVADIIIRMSHELERYADDGCVFIASGIIEQRADEVLDAMAKTPFKHISTATEKGWCALVFKLQK